MNFVDKITKSNWAPNSSSKIETEHDVTQCFVPNGPSVEKSDALAKDLLTNTKLVFKKVPMKYIPGKVYFPKDTSSCLTKAEQAICLKIKQKQVTGCELSAADKQLLVAKVQTLQPAIKEENIKFLKYAEEDWKKRSQRANIIRPPLYTYARSAWERKLLRCRAYPQYYILMNTLSLQHVPSVKVSRSEEILQLGVVAEFTPPALLLKFVPLKSSLPVYEEPQTFNSKMPVSMDENISNFVTTCNVDVVISSSALKLLMDDSDYGYDWNIPIVVKKHNISVDGRSFEKDVIYLDKPLPKRTPTNIDFNEKCLKRLILTNFCFTPRVIYPKSEMFRENPFYSQGSEVSASSNFYVNNKIYHNVSYDIWNLKLDEDDHNRLMKTRVSSQEIRIIIRYKLNACETLSNGTKQPLVIVPKLEQQVELGANIPTKSEVNRQWTSLFFRPYSHLYRVRMQANTSEVVSIEKVSLEKLNWEAATHYNSRPHLRLGALYTILLGLKQRCSTGHYLLHHISKQGSFVDLLKAQTSDCKKAQATAFDLHYNYSIDNCKIAAAPRNWCPIDVNYVLPVHLTFKRMPGMFKPLLPQEKHKGISAKTRNMIKNKKKATKKKGKERRLYKSH